MFFLINSTRAGISFEREILNDFLNPSGKEWKKIEILSSSLFFLISLGKKGRHSVFTSIKNFFRAPASEQPPRLSRNGNEKSIF
jgi:hypothetical protein